MDYYYYQGWLFIMTVHCTTTQTHHEPYILMLFSRQTWVSQLPLVFPSLLKRTFRDNWLTVCYKSAVPVT